MRPCPVVGGMSVLGGRWCSGLPCSGSRRGASGILKGELTLLLSFAVNLRDRIQVKVIAEGVALRSSAGTLYIYIAASF